MAEEAKNIFEEIVKCESVHQVLCVLGRAHLTLEQLGCKWSDIEGAENALFRLSNNLDQEGVDEVRIALSDADDNGVDWSTEWVAKAWDAKKDRLVYIPFPEDNLSSLIEEVNRRMATIEKMNPSQWSQTEETA